MANPFANTRLRRRVRLFVSSTFSDLQAERRELVERTFPLVRSWCEQRGIAFIECDLRWGITDAEANAGRVLPICFEELEDCRPFFLGILSDRYGSRAHSIPPDLLEQHPWLAACPHRSFTELEFEHGLFRPSPEDVCALVYLREPSPAPDDALTDTDDVRRLESLRQRVRDLGLPMAAHPFRSAHELGERVSRDLIARLQEVFPEDGPPDPIQRELERQRHALESLASNAHAPEAPLRAIDRAIAADSRPLVLRGPSGGGKSTLLALWVHRQAARPASEDPAPGWPLPRRLTAWWRNQESRPPRPAVVAFARVGVSAMSQRWPGLARLLAQQLARHPGLESPAEDPEADPLTLLAGLAARLAPRHTVVLAVDGLEHLPAAEFERTEGGLSLLASLGVRVIGTLRDEVQTPRLADRGWQGIDVPAWATDDRSRFLNAFAERHRKHLPEDLRKRFLRAPACARPLFLKTCLEELRLAATHADLASRADAQLAHTDLAGLFASVIARLESGPGDTSLAGDLPVLLGRTLCLLWAARRGLTEAELRALAPPAGAPRLGAYAWAQVLVPLRPHLIESEGCLILHQPEFRLAVERRYLDSEAGIRAVRHHLAGAFHRHPLQPRALVELPWQLRHLQDWAALESLMTDPAWLAEAWRLEREELLETVGALETALAPRRLVDLLQPHHEQFHGPAAAAAGQLLFALGESTLAGEFLTRASPPPPPACGSNVSPNTDWAETLALIRQRSGDLAGAGRILDAAIARARDAGQAQKLAWLLGNRGTVLREQGDHHAARAHFAEEESIAAQLHDPDLAVRVLGHRGQREFDEARFADAEATFQAMARQARQAGNLRLLQAALGNQGAALARLGRIEPALQAYQSQRELCERRSDRHSLQGCLGNLALLLQERNPPDYDEAMRLLETRETLCRALGDPLGLATTWWQLAVLTDRLAPDRLAAGIAERLRQAHDLARHHGAAELEERIASFARSRGLMP